MKGRPKAPDLMCPGPPPMTRERIAEVRDGLQAATESINPLILRAEEVFVRLGLTTETSIPIAYADPPPRGRPSSRKSVHRLGWTPIGGRWKMALYSRPAQDGDQTLTQVTPLIWASRETRLAALSLIKEFHAALVAASSSV